MDWPPTSETRTLIKNSSGRKHAILRIKQETDQSIYISSLFEGSRTEVIQEENGDGVWVDKDYHLSIHASGQVHLRTEEQAESKRIIQFQIPEIRDLEVPVKIGEIQPSDLESFPEINKEQDIDQLVQTNYSLDNRFTIQIYIGPARDLKDQYHAESKIYDELCRDQLLPPLPSGTKATVRYYEENFLSIYFVVAQTPALREMEHIDYEQWFFNVLDNPEEYIEQTKRGTVPDNYNIENLEVDK